MYIIVNAFHLCVQWYGRYIDEILVIWREAVSVVLVFTQYINNNPFNHKIVHSAQGSYISFLDLNLVGKTDKIIESSTFRKKNGR